MACCAGRGMDGSNVCSVGRPAAALEAVDTALVVRATAVGELRTMLPFILHVWVY